MKLSPHQPKLRLATLTLLAVSLSCLPFRAPAGEPETSTPAKETKDAAAAPAMAAPGATPSKKLSEAELRAKLTSEQYKVTQESGTEEAFKNAYYDNHKPGIYVDVVSGEPLFSSTDKFDSGTGWPSFSKPLVKENVYQRGDNSLGIDRLEIRSKGADSHLGHLFDDGPKPTGNRYCINSASLRFVPKDKLKAEGYGQFLSLFEKKEKK